LSSSILWVVAVDIDKEKKRKYLKKELKTENKIFYFSCLNLYLYRNTLFNDALARNKRKKSTEKTNVSKKKMMR